MAEPIDARPPCEIGTPAALPNARLNFFLGVINGAFFMFGSAFMNPTTVLPVFIKGFTDSDLLVGVAGSLQKAGWHLPQLFIASRLERLPRKMGSYLAANAVRMVFSVLMILVIALFATHHPLPALYGFLFCYGVACFAGGFAGLPFTDIVAKTVVKRHRGSFYALRMFLGAGILSVLAGLTIGWVLTRQGRFPFPQNYVLLFSIGIGLMLLGILFFALIREPEGKVSSGSGRFVDVVREIPAIMRADPVFRRLVAVEVLASGIGFSLPFYIILVQERFGVSPRAVGVFLAIQTIGVTFSNVIWSRISLRYGNLRVVYMTTIGQVFIPVYALGLAWLTPRLLQGASEVWIIAAFCPVFLMIGATISGSAVGFTSFLLDVAPEERRPTYMALSNTIIGFAALFPALGGWLSDVVNLEAVFFVSALAVLASMVLCHGLTRLVQEAPA